MTEALKGTLQDSFDTASGRGGSGSASFNLHKALMEKAEAHIPDGWEQNPGGYKRAFVETAKQHMQTQADMHWQENKDFGPAEQQKIIDHLPTELEALQVETYYLNRDLLPETQTRRSVIDRTTSELSVAAQYERMGGPDVFDDSVMVQSQIDNIIERAAENGKIYGFSPEKSVEDMTGAPLPGNTMAQLEMNMKAETAYQEPELNINIPDNAL